MDDWIISTTRKTHQRKLNKVIKALNKNIENDDLWMGRFFIRQYSAEFYKYEDGSGGELYVYLRFYDKKDKKYMEYYGDSCSICHFGGTRLWHTMNDFIVEITSAWKDGRPYENKQDYRSVSCDEVVKNATPYKDYVMQVRF